MDVIRFLDMDALFSQMHETMDVMRFLDIDALFFSNALDHGRH